jgi:hypothetical protein
MERPKEDRDPLKARVNGLECVGHYAHWRILKEGDVRIVYDPTDNRIITEYNMSGRTA